MLDHSTAIAMRQRVFAMLVRVTRGDRPLAEDLTQQTFQRLLEELEAGKRPAKSMMQWTLGIAYKLFLRECRRRTRTAQMSGAALDGDADITLGTLAASPEVLARLAQVEATFRALPPKQQEAYLHTHVYGFSTEEAATELNLPTGTVKSRSHRAHHALMAALNPEAG